MESHGYYNGQHEYDQQVVNANGHFTQYSPEQRQIISRTQKQSITQNISQTTRTVKEVHYIGPDGVPLDYIPDGQIPPNYPAVSEANYQNQQFMASYGRYGAPPTPPSPRSDRSSSPPPHHRQGYHPLYIDSNGPGNGGAVPQSGYAELDTTLMPPRASGGAQQLAQEHYRSTPSPRNAASNAHPGYAGSSPNHRSSVSSSNPDGGGPPSQHGRTSVSEMSQYGRTSVADGNRRDGSVADLYQQQGGRASVTDSYYGGRSNSVAQSVGGRASVTQSIGGRASVTTTSGADIADGSQFAIYGSRKSTMNNMDYQQQQLQLQLQNNYSNINNHAGLYEDDGGGEDFGGVGGGYGEYPGGVTPLSRPAPRAVFVEDEPNLPQAVGSNSSPHHQQSPAMHGMGGGMPSVQYRDPDLGEVIQFLSNPCSVIQANACAYLQHLCYMDDPVKARTRQLGGIPPLVALLNTEIPEIHRPACGALRNLSFGRQNDENKRAIKEAGGISCLVKLLRRSTDNEVKELVTGVLWNLSSCDDLKRTIIDECLVVIVSSVIVAHSGWDRQGQGTDTHWTTVFRNASGILRNVSSAGDYGRKKLRECEGLVESLLYLVRNAIERANIDNKSVENAVCVLRNLSYRAQEVEDPNYDKRQLPAGESRASARPTSENPGCFGASKQKGAAGKGGAAGSNGGPLAGSSQAGGIRAGSNGVTGTGMDLLWQPEVVQPYLNLLSNCSNPETLEAAAGAIQNLSACYWQPSVDIRAAVRKEKGLPILVELLRMEVDRVVCAVATALRNLAIDQRNKELIGKYAMRDLVQKLPSGNPQRDVGTSDDTIAAVLATLNEVIKKHPEFSRSLMEAGGVDRLINITRQRAKYSSRVVKFASQVLFSMWQHQDLREVYKKSGWKESDFVTKTVAARNARPNSPTHLNSTLNRPMASQGGTRYEDRTMVRSNVGGGSGGGGGSVPGGGRAHHGNNIQHQYHGDNLAMENLSLYGATAAGQRIPPQGAHMIQPGEPVYAQVNRDKKRSSHSNPADQSDPAADYSEHNRHWAVQDNSALENSGSQPPAGDSWV